MSRSSLLRIFNTASICLVACSAFNLRVVSSIGTTINFNYNQKYQSAFRADFKRTSLHAKHNRRVKEVIGDEEDVPESQSGSIINWYPGHIAKAERTLEEYLKLVDVVVEVRDSRIPQSTTHPLVPKWVGSRPLIIVMARADVVPNLAIEDWKRFYTKEEGMAHTGRKSNVPVYFVDSKRGKHVHQVKKAILKAGSRINERRISRGINPRSVRVAVIGYPNVGKSALINQLVGKSVASSRNIPGVTKKINWIRLSNPDRRPEQELELLDSPGIIPAKQDDQRSALQLAICNDIGQASYDTQRVSAAMIDHLVETAVQFPGYLDLNAVQNRYGIDPKRYTGEEFLHKVAMKLYHGQLNSAADRLLGDFRKGYLGNAALEAPPSLDETNSLRLKSKAENNYYSDESLVVSEVRQFNYAEASKSIKNEREYVGTGEFEGW